MLKARLIPPIVRSPWFLSSANALWPGTRPPCSWLRPAGGGEPPALPMLPNKWWRIACCGAYALRLMSAKRASGSSRPKSGRIDVLINNAGIPAMRCE